MRSLALLFTPSLASLECDAKWSEYLQHFPSVHSPLDQIQRKVVFCDNLHMIERFNKVDPTATYSHLSPFAAYTEEEFNRLKGASAHGMPYKGKISRVPTLGDVPEEFDWTSHKGVVNPIKNQAQCGSCWAFSTIANIESAFVVQKNGTLYSLAEQQLVSCSSMYPEGCQGGLPWGALQELSNNAIAIETEKDYPYTAKEDQCSYDQNSGVVTITGNLRFGRDSNELKAALIKYGPLSVLVDASKKFMVYTNGVIRANECSNNSFNHAVNIVGYGDDCGTEYWKVRNSWTDRWGEKGYFRVELDQCYINQYAVTATFDDDDDE